MTINASAIHSLAALSLTEERGEVEENRGEKDAVCAPQLSLQLILSRAIKTMTSRKRRDSMTRLSLVRYH